MTDVIVETSTTDPRAKPLIEDLIREYDGRYGFIFNPEGSQAELYRYAKVLARWGLEEEALERSETNPPGLPQF